MNAEGEIGKPRENVFKRNGKILVSKVPTDEQDLKSNILKAVNLIDGFDKIV